jgi:MSHA biogenesis protein MshQ
LEGIRLDSQIQAPASGENGTLGRASYDHVLGNQTFIDNQSISEVGVFKITASPGSYIDGVTVDGGESGLVGRFIPASLDVVGSATLTPSCGASFSYQGQPMYFSTVPNLRITGKNRQGNITRNYDIDPFWRLPTPTRSDVPTDPDDDYSSATGVASLDASGRLLRGGAMDTTTSEAGNKDGARVYSWRGSVQPDGTYKGEALSYAQPLNPISDDYPFGALVRLSFPLAMLRDSDLACYGGTTCSDYSFTFGGSNVRLGRLRIGNALGSELQSLSLPLALETWQSDAGGSFKLEELDTCTTSGVLGTPFLDGYTDGLALGETTASLSWPATLNNRAVSLTAPGNGNAGSVQVSFSAAPTWLQYPWNGATRSAARGLASFGVYKGATPLIFRRELYR